MSRHQNVKKMVLDDELGDFDGDDDYEYDDGDSQELSEEDREQLREGTVKVREVIGNDVPGITDSKIQEALWHYYYDIEKSITYLLNSQASASEKKKKAGGKKVQESALEGLSTCSNPFSYDKFFEDMPWLRVPEHRKAVFLVPLLPHGGLLGGSSGAPPPKMSKLQALAAARKKKAEEKKGESSTRTIEKPMTELSLKSTPREESKFSQVLGSRHIEPQQEKKRKNSIPHQRNVHVSERSPSSGLRIEQSATGNAASMMARPSAFAETLFSSRTRSIPSIATFTVPYDRDATTNAFAEPSPDDVVLAAQAKAKGKGSKGASKIKGEMKAAQIANGVEAMKLDVTPKSKSKNLDVLAEFEKTKSKNAANFVVIGHVDAGKSTLMGRLLYDLGVVDQRTIDRYRKEAENMGKSSFALAWVLDQGTEERSRGVTIDIATNKFTTERTNFTILDAPGHRDFIPNMIAGASQADFAVLVVDASTGSFESGLRGQTKEHALLVRSMGVQRVIIAVNKLDTVQWSRDRFDEISQQLSAFLTHAGFAPKNLIFIPVSGLKGDNIVRRSAEPSASWYTGPTLMEDLENSEPMTRALEKPLRITIGDIFRGGVQNPLSVSGRIEAGSLQTGDALIAQPSGEKCFIKGVEVDHDNVDWAVAGQNVTVHLSDIEPTHLKIGDVLCTSSDPIKCVKTFTTKLLAFEFLTPMGVDVHRGRLHAAGKITQLVAVLDKGSGQIVKKKPKIVKPGMVVRVVVEMADAVPLEAPGRVVLRNGGETVAAGLLE